jgi:hypothetical protein
MMRYRYFIHLSADTTAATFETNEPLPHLSVGTHLALTTDEFEHRSGTSLEIRHIQVTISHLKGDLVRYDVHIQAVELAEPPRF